jgi:2-C-methyl-D-erythritol 4-phosphate cytidylyltransferase
MEHAGHQVSLVPSSPMNLKITTKDDLKLAEQLLKALPKAKGFPF